MLAKLGEVKEALIAIAGVGAVVITIGGFYMEWRIDKNVTDTVNAQGAITPDQLARVTDAQMVIEEDVEDLKDEDDKLDGKIERIVQILLEE